MIASKRKSKDIRCPPAKPSRHLPASARPWQAGPSRYARHHGTQRRRTGGARRTGHENRPLIDNSLQLMNWQHMICHNSSVQDNSISIDAAMCPKRIVTGMLEFTGVLEYWSTGNSFFPLLHHSITPRCHASRTPFLSMFSAYLSNIHHLFWTRVL